VLAEAVAGGLAAEELAAVLLADQGDGVASGEVGVDLGAGDAPPVAGEPEVAEDADPAAVAGGLGGDGGGGVERFGHRVTS